MDPYGQVVLAARPEGLPRAGNFRVETGPMPEPLEGQVLVATKFLSLDPYMRGRMNECVREDALTERCESVPELVATL